MVTLRKLFEPISFSGITLKNRIIMSPMGCNLESAEGEVTKPLLNYFFARAKVGAAMITIGVGLVHPHGRGISKQLRLDEDRFIPGLFTLTRVIHEGGALACIQVHHAGRFGRVGIPVAPSIVPTMDPTGKLIELRVLTLKEIKDLVDQFAMAAFRAKCAGFDMVEIHGGTGYLVGQFVSPCTNKRTDEYGGSFKNRIRFPLEILGQIKQKCGSDFPVGYRMAAEEWIPEGFHLEEAKKFAVELEEAGVAYLSITGGTLESILFGEGFLAMRSPKARVVPYAEVIKREVKVPVFTTGKIADPLLMEEIIRQGKADAVALGRPLLSDPELPKKAKEGNLEDIRICTSCCYCLDVLFRDWPLSCFQNPEVGREEEFKITLTNFPKKILVIGGGPGGLEAARIAALRGHEVALWEKERELGGQLRLAALAKGKEAYLTCTIKWLVRQCEKLRVKIELNKMVKAEMVEKFSPDVIILAIGASAHIPSLPGIEGENVITYKEVLTEEVNLDGRQVVLAGGGFIGAETADFLAERGARVTIIEMLPEIAIDMDLCNRAYLIQKLEENKVRIKTNCKVEAIEKNRAIIRNAAGSKESIDADAIVLALGTVSNKSLLKDLRVKEIGEIYTIGDCVEPRKAANAIHEGSYIARQI